MKRFDEQMRKKLQNEKITMPDDMSQRFDETLSQIQQNCSDRDFKTFIFKMSMKLTAAAVAVMLVLIPNINKDIAYALHEMPFIGSIIEVICVYEFETEDSTHYEKIRMPEVMAAELPEETVEYINEDVELIIVEAKENYEEDLADNPDSYSGMGADYETLTDTGEWFALKVYIYSTEASGNETFKIYNIDKTTGTVPELKDLFVEGFDYVAVLTDNVIRQMEKQCEEDENVSYWIYPDDNTYWGFSAIYEDQSYYFDENGQLVLVFEEYQVGPGYMGCPEFVIPEGIYEEYLK